MATYTLRTTIRAHRIEMAIFVGISISRHNYTIKYMISFYEISQSYKY